MLLPILTIALLLPYWSLDVQNLQQDVRGAVLGLLAVPLQIPDHSLTISLLAATPAELAARCEGSRFGVAGGFITNSLPFPYYFLTGRYTCRIGSKM